MAKLTLSDLANLENQSTAVATINANNALIEDVAERALYRDGTSPNTMVSDLDMNSKRILNLAAPTSNNEPARFVDLVGVSPSGSVISGMTSKGIPIAASATSITSSATLTDGQLLVGQTGNIPLAKTITGDVTFSAAGATTIKNSVALGGSPTVATPAILSNSTLIASTEYVDRTTREKLSGNRTYFVRTDGSDSNNGLTNTAGGAFLTIQKGLTVAQTLDANGFQITVQVGNGTYTAGAALVSPTPSHGRILLQGDTATPSNVLISTTGTTCFGSAIPGSILWIAGFKLQTTTSGFGLLADSGGQIYVSGKMEYGTCATSHIIAAGGGKIYINTDYSITGAAVNSHMVSQRGAQIHASGLTITGSGALAFAPFVLNDSLSLTSVFGNNYTGTGSFTGTRYTSSSNGVIFTSGGGAAYLPGSIAGSTATGGQYI